MQFVDGSQILIGAMLKQRSVTKTEIQLSIVGNALEESEWQQHHIFIFHALWRIRRQTGGQTLEMTKTGKFLDAITTEKTYPYLKPAWNKASQNFARGADGAVDVFQSSQGVRLESVWRTVEYPELINGGNAINFHVTP